MSAAAKKVDPHLAQEQDTLELLQRIMREHGGQLRWGLQVRLEEKIEELAERVDQWWQP